MGAEIIEVPKVGVIPRGNGEYVGVITVKATQIYSELSSLGRIERQLSLSMGIALEGRC